MKPERIEELRAKLRDAMGETADSSCYIRLSGQDMTDFLALLDEKAAQLKAGEGQPGAKNLRQQGVTPSPGLSDADERALDRMGDAIKLAARARYNPRGMGPERGDKEKGLDETAIAYFRSRLAAGSPRAETIPVPSEGVTYQVWRDGLWLGALSGEDSAILSVLSDRIFIAHIQSHLKPGQEVVCKICGRTAKEICGEKPAPPSGEEDK